MVTPLYIEIALHYYCRQDDFPRLTAPACREAVGRMIDAGLLEVDFGARVGDPVLCATDGLRAWVDAMRSVPMPEQHWVVPSVKEQNIQGTQ